MRHKTWLRKWLDRKDFQLYWMRSWSISVRVKGEAVFVHPFPGVMIKWWRS